MLVYTLFGILEYMTTLKVLHFGSIIGIGYTSRAIGGFFEKGKKMNYFKTFVSYILGMISFSITAIILGNLIDLIVRLQQLKV